MFQNVSTLPRSPLVEPLINGDHRCKDICPLIRGVRFIEKVASYTHKCDGQGGGLGDIYQLLHNNNQMIFTVKIMFRSRYISIIIFWNDGDCIQKLK